MAECMQPERRRCRIGRMRYRQFSRRNLSNLKHQPSRLAKQCASWESWAGANSRTFPPTRGTWTTSGNESNHHGQRAARRLVLQDELRALLEFKRAQAGTPSEIPVRAAGRDNPQPGKRRSPARLALKSDSTPSSTRPSPSRNSSSVRAASAHRASSSCGISLARYPAIFRAQSALVVIRLLTNRKSLLRRQRCLAGLGGSQVP